MENKDLPFLACVVPGWSFDEKTSLTCQKKNTENYINIQSANLNVRISQRGTALILHQVFFFK